MRRRIVLRPAAEADIVAAAAWYEEQSPNAGSRFWRVVEAKLELARDNPLQYQALQGRYRRVLLHPFEYIVIYTFNDDELIVVACMHGRRHPKRWQDRIRE
jgi:plasmid stabilization system protein ParE